MVPKSGFQYRNSVEGDQRKREHNFGTSIVKHLALRKNCFQFHFPYPFIIGRFSKLL